MRKPLYPTFNISNLDANKSQNDLLNADRFKEYLSKNPHLQVVHNHSFYHLVYFTEGKGEHTIDFEKFPVQKGLIYFMRPGQVHNWHFKGAVDGYIVNFSPPFFDRLFISSNFLQQFPFFDGYLQNQVLYLNKTTQKKVEPIFEAIIQEQAAGKDSVQLMTASLLVQLFLTISREMSLKDAYQSPTNHNAILLKKFQQLIEDNFHNIKLPKAYAALLFITPHHLNALCKDFLHIPAGEVIRNRIILETKRLLVNFELSIGDIAMELNFPDTSYFVKFFKKYTGITPDNFRNEYYKT